MNKGRIKVWLDTNIIVYALDLDSPFHKDAFELMKMAERGKVEGCINTLSLFNALFLLGNGAEESLYRMAQLLRVVDLESPQAMQCLRSDWSDKKDAYQHECALAAGVGFHRDRRSQGFQAFRDRHPIYAGLFEFAVGTWLFSAGPSKKSSQVALNPCPHTH